MQLNEFIDEVYERAGVDRNDPLITDTAVTKAVNNALRHYQFEVDWPWLQATTTFVTTTADTYAVPDDWRKTRVIKDANGTELRRFDMRQLEDRWTGVETGSPQEFAIDADLIVLRPRPSAGLTLTHRYVRKEKMLLQSDDSPYLPDESSILVAEYASSILLRKTRRYSDATVAMQMYEAEMLKMRDDRRRAVGPGRPRIRTGSSY